ncbi:3-deoxy-manno-octulosonate cytidylyltransferase [Leptospira ognonensis]|uniref:3-deoxy-manno-octulosonate cytidylyltransferase n=1 Tax=Leptospira ognonensis TaxID=2484945 RepID=A0A4R9JU41_9LEPT|nr:3-deoxy-manno-octulosonate cytidylyltransferase [Leptospira ognonensis]TGL56313.1 3-deoxy-manno-octulosonate cytidylyltransferase [Leptospira ognonensis]
MTKKVLGVIPARYASTRFPAKPLAMIGNKTMVEWTFIHSLKSKSIDHLVVATDHEEIKNTVEKFGGNVILTREDHPTGTDRLIEVCEKLLEFEIIVNIQGDEPGIEHELIDGVVALKKKHEDWEMTTAAVPFIDSEDPKDPNKVKVVFDHQYKANYFSRSPIPASFKKEAKYYRHLGIYCYEKNFLLQYHSLPQSSWEEAESLEQLRALQAGRQIGVYLANKANLGVDTPADLLVVQAEFKKLGLIS